ncbi:hypothetical protein C1O66_16440 [Paucibacter aquatile]|uniref:Phosphatidic acid phosphatase type 2/haloperoxidase domain-containing protein n=1 Tax=Kinneretia aquatilis TaxID=2070761 RepID=A0A2N8KZS0_9BURK|nr:phosphatase PAP2 family protein [Paucibacter aquatile]PND38959.1 hypothetical protein C1O66_16440 [Paucibacter aquatile]
MNWGFASSAVTLWPWLTRLGEAQFLLPLALLGLAWVWRSAGARAAQRAWAWRALALLAAVIGVTTASKLAFMGWGLGIARWDFTGFSGHSMFAAAVLPLLTWLALAASPAVSVRADRESDRGRFSTATWAWIGLSYALAALIAYSRLKVGAHSVSESVTGFLLGAVASGASLWLAPTLRRGLPRGLPMAALALLLLMPSMAPPSRSHDWVTHWALQLSGRQQPVDRRDLQEPEAGPELQHLQEPTS